MVRCAMQSFQDKTVICPHDWTVLRLKQHLRDVCDHNPVPERQRLIYSGQCLKDESTVGTILRIDPSDSDQIHVFHLVYTPSVRELKQQRVIAKDPSASNEGPETTLRNRFISDSTVRSAEILPTQAPPSAEPIIAGQGPGEQLDASQHWAQAQQQMYQAYMTNYMNYMNQMYSAMYGGAVAGGGLPLMAAGLIPQATPATAPSQNGNNRNGAAVVGHQGEAGPDGQPQRPQNNAAGPQDPAMNAQGGVDDEEMRDRDWLDWLYMGSRGALLVMILYFYSSFARFTFVVLAILAMYGFNAGWFGARGGQGGAAQQNQDEAQQQEGPAVVPEAERNPPEEREGAGTEERGDHVEGAQGEGPREVPGAQPQPPSAWAVFWSTCFTFVTTFFTSLIPERPPPVNVN